MILPAIQQCRDLLKSLGTCAQEVAQSLAEKKITGLRRHGRCCPVANYLTQEFVKDPGLESLGFTVSCTVIVAYDPMSNVAFSIATPTPIFFFVKNFDRKDYPHLETP